MKMLIVRPSKIRARVMELLRGKQNLMASSVWTNLNPHERVSSRWHATGKEWRSQQVSATRIKSSADSTISRRLSQRFKVVLIANEWYQT